MRTSRVTGRTANAYGTMRKPVESNSEFSFASNDQHALDQFTQQQSKKKKKKRQPQFNGNVQSNRSHKTIKGLFFNTQTVMQMRNEMIQTTMIVNYVSYRKSIHRTYRDSI